MIYLLFACGSTVQTTVRIVKVGVYALMSSNTTASIRLKKVTREKLADLGRKNQSYDEVIRDLIGAKYKLDLLERKVRISASSKSLDQ